MKTVFKPFLILPLLLLTGCAGFRHPPKTTDFYTLAYDPPAPVAMQAKPVVIYLKRLRGLPPFNSQQIVYATSDTRRNIYFYHQWIADPAGMVTDLLARDLKHANIVEAVVTSPGELHATYRLQGTLDDFYEFDGKSQWTAIISLTLLFTRETADGGSALLFQKTYRTTSTLKQKNPLGLARAMSIALSHISARVASDINQNLN